MAIIGLGSGVTASFARKEDSITFYELDPDNEEIAQLCFTFWDECRGKIDFVPGDGRLSLQKKAKEGIQYDLIMIDAFSGDGIPTNLLTKEAIEIYLSRLAPKGVVLFHVSNRNYEIRPVIKAIARDLKVFGVRNIPIPKKNLKSHQNATKCVVLAKDPQQLAPLLQRGWVSLENADGFATMSPWTDEYVNVLHPLIENIRIRLAENGDK
jgi:spermidine synthase